MTKGFTSGELDALQLWPITVNKIPYYVNMDHPEWTGNDKAFVSALNDESKWDDAFPVYKRCSSANKLGVEQCFFPLNLFARTSTGSWDSSVQANQNAVNGIKREEFREKNIQFLRIYATGSVDGRIHCPFLKFQIDAVKIHNVVQNLWVQHHFRFVNGSSVHKENVNPGAILASTDFTLVSPRSREGLKDMARTVFLSATAHDALHRVQRDGDIRDYELDQLPWALRSEQNWLDFNGFLISFGHDSLGDYAKWMAEQVNSEVV